MQFWTKCWKNLSIYANTYSVLKSFNTIKRKDIVKPLSEAKQLSFIQHLKQNDPDLQIICQASADG